MRIVNVTQAGLARPVLIACATAIAPTMDDVSTTPVSVNHNTPVRTVKLKNVLQIALDTVNVPSTPQLNTIVRLPQTKTKVWKVVFVKMAGLDVIAAKVCVDHLQTVPNMGSAWAVMLVTLTACVKNLGEDLLATESNVTNPALTMVFV
jgi:hypothetical protein